VEVRLQDYREVLDGSFDAISSIGIFEHVGLRNLGLYFRRLYRLLRPGSVREPGPACRSLPRVSLGIASSIDTCSTDGELHEVGAVVSTMHAAGFEVRPWRACGSTTR
jgi:cyclopropane-fatty-acyl-phospholipid synthase